MRLASIKVRNFRSIASAEICLSPFVCIVGHNNAGKSSLLMALSLFRSGSSLKSSDFYNANESIEFEVMISGIDEDALSRLGVHADRIKEIVFDNTINLIRRYGTDGKSTLNCRKYVPKDDRFSADEITALLSGKKNNDLQDAVKKSFPELEEQVNNERPTSQRACKEMIEKLAKSLGPDQLEFRESSLPTGIPASIEQILPEVIYIPAVADATDEVKTKEASSFGKIIRVLLDLVEQAEELKDIAKSFTTLHGLLNRSVDENGEPADTRLEDVKRIEQRVQGFIQEQFRDVGVEIEIPPPELKTIFSGAKIWLDDGVRGEVESKGDGLKRAVTFSLFRTFVELKREQESRKSKSEEEPHLPKYLFLFEEPELYLHPNAQRILYDALREISDEHQVCVCTHSPYFFSASDTGTYIRLCRTAAKNPEFAPYSQARHISLADDLSVKDSFQIVCYENNNAAFFCDRVLLVEGDCDIIYLKHLARTLNPVWDFDRQNIAIVKVGGKGSFERYRHFFESFSVEVRIVADLDVIVDEFEKLGATKDVSSLRSVLIQEIDKVSQNVTAPESTRSQIKEIVGRRSFKEKYQRCKIIAEKIAGGTSINKEESEEFGMLFLEEEKYVRRHILATDANLRDKKEEVLKTLRNEGIVVLSKGAIEAYYPDGVEGNDKPSKALAACEKVTCANEVHKLCDMIEDKSELELVFECIFG